MVIISLFVCFMPNYIWFLTFIIFFNIGTKYGYVYEFVLLILLLLLVLLVLLLLLVLLFVFWLVWLVLFYGLGITVWFVWFVVLFFIVWLDELEIDKFLFVLAVVFVVFVGGWGNIGEIWDEDEFVVFKVLTGVEFVGFVEEDALLDGEVWLEVFVIFF
jgi:hypothetical protein